MAMQPEPGGEQKRDPAFDAVIDDSSLPRAMLIGDSISVGYTLPVRKILAGKVNLHRASENCGPTSAGVEKIDAWLGASRWDVIHFNFGLHDLKIMPGGNHQVPPEQYAANLRKILERLKATGARLIWASTTPVPEGNLSPPRHPGDVVAYNSAARSLLDLHPEVAHNDLYAFALPRLKEVQLPVNVHFTPEGSHLLGQQVAASILAALKK
jgi:lysophospholipase L1-like esterase